MRASGRIFDVLLAGVADMPDGVGAVVGDEERSIPGDGDADGAAPDIAVRSGEAGEEVLVFAGGMAVLMGTRMTS